MHEDDVAVAAVSGCERIFRDPATGRIYIASIGPFEREGGRGVCAQLNALIFEGVHGEWIGSAPIDHTVTLESLTEADLLHFLRWAVARG